MTKFRPPVIASELAIALSYLNWTPEQLASLAKLLDLELPLPFLELATTQRLQVLRNRADPVNIQSLTATLAFVGVHFRENVFGIELSPLTRLAVDARPNQVLVALIALLPESQIALAVHKFRRQRYVAVAIATENRLLLWDGGDELDPAEAISHLYANALLRTSVCDELLTATATLDIEQAAERFRSGKWAPAQRVPKTRMTALLSTEGLK